MKSDLNNYSVSNYSKVLNILLQNQKNILTVADLYSIANSFKENKEPDIAAQFYWCCLSNGYWKAAYPLYELLFENNFLVKQQEFAIVLYAVASKFNDTRCIEPEKKIFIHQMYMANDIFKYIQKVQKQEITTVNIKQVIFQLEELNKIIKDSANHLKIVDLVRYKVDDYFVPDNTEDLKELLGEQDEGSCIIT